jgi:hypothetical protein
VIAAAEQVVVSMAEETDTKFVMALQRKNRESVGGLPTPAIQERITRRTLLLARINGQPVGYLMYDVGQDGIIRIPQACIEYDARRRAYGFALVGQMLNLHPTALEIRLRCAADIDANVFWRSLGFVCVGTTPGGSRRGRIINLWQKWLDARLIQPSDVAVTPAWQRRVDCFDEQTGFSAAAPVGFADAGELPKLAWSNRKATS